jgi:hypothetical protein
VNQRRKDKGYPQDPEVLRIAALVRRPLLASDVPNEPWRDDYANYLLRADGVIESETCGALALVRPDGKVAWYR